MQGDWIVFCKKTWHFIHKSEDNMGRFYIYLHESLMFIINVGKGYILIIAVPWILYG